MSIDNLDTITGLLKKDPYKTMAFNTAKDNLMEPVTLQEAINTIKFITSTHKQEITKLREKNRKQSEIIRKLEATRKQELDYLSLELQKYEINLALRTETITKQLAEKDEIIQKQLELIDELNKKLNVQEEIRVPEIHITSTGDSNSDSGIAMDNDENTNPSIESKTESKTTRKCRRFAESISFLRRVDFSPMKYKPSVREQNKKKEERKSSLEVPSFGKRLLTRQLSNERATSEDERSKEAVLSDDALEGFVIKPKKMNDSMNNHFSDDGSEDTSEDAFDRIMTRNSIRRSVKANPKYKKINRTKSKLLEQVKNNIVD